jgi:hypothetical protein
VPGQALAETVVAGLGLARCEIHRVVRMLKFRQLLSLITCNLLRDKIAKPRTLRRSFNFSRPRDLLATGIVLGDLIPRNLTERNLEDSLPPQRLDRRPGNLRHRQTTTGTYLSFVDFASLRRDFRRLGAPDYQSQTATCPAMLMRVQGRVVVSVVCDKSTARERLDFAGFAVSESLKSLSSRNAPMSKG